MVQTHGMAWGDQASSQVMRCGDIELAAFLADAAGPVPLVLDLRIAHQRWGKVALTQVLMECYIDLDLLT
jgi:hypothetical protein